MFIGANRSCKFLSTDIFERLVFCKITHASFYRRGVDMGFQLRLCVCVCVCV